MKRLKLNTNCRHYVGGKPCRVGTMCEGCEQFDPMGTRVLVIKLGAMGDVLRTTALLPALRKKYEPCHVTWVVDGPAFDLLRANPLIDRLLPMDLGTTLRVETSVFDVAICLDKEDRAVGLMHKARAAEKLGFGIDAFGGIRPLNQEADYAFSLGVSDELKFFQNDRCYQDFTAQAARLAWRGDDYVFAVPDEEKEWAYSRLTELGVKRGDRLLGLNTGAGPVFATKKWTRGGFAEIARRGVKELGARVLLLGGPEERDRNRQIAAMVSDLGDAVVDTGTDNPLLGFAATLGNLDLLVTGDTMAMHVALAQKVPTIAIFGPTCQQEVELYGRGEKVTTAPPCAPCYRKECEEQAHKCMEELLADTVFAAVKRWWKPSK